MYGSARESAPKSANTADEAGNAASAALGSAGSNASDFHLMDLGLPVAAPDSHATNLDLSAGAPDWKSFVTVCRHLVWYITVAISWLLYR